MATIARQPFAPLDGARLQTLTSMKNRQNAVSANSPAKRKVADLDTGDFENVDPSVFSKRSKGGLDGFSKNKSSSTPDLFKPSAFVLTKAAPSAVAASPPGNDVAGASSTLSPIKAALPRPRQMLNPKSPAAKLNTSFARSPLSAPAGRSPTRGSKRVGILGNRRRTGSPFTRVDPPAFKLPSAPAAPFSLDAALKGTIPSYAGRSSASSSSAAERSSSLHEPEMKASWFFDIHEDTPEQEMTNLLQHGTCVLDISSDEESALRANRERAEGRDKENIPPADDVSQTSSRARGPDAGDMVVEKSRDPLAEMNAADFYAEGCDPSSVVIVPGDVDVEDASGTAGFAFAPDLSRDVSGNTSLITQDSGDSGAQTMDEMLAATKAEPAAKAAVLEPIEGTGDSFELWESGSAREEGEVGGVDSPVPASPAPSDAETEVLGEE